MPEPLRILADDHRVVVVDKPAGVTSEDVAIALGRRLVHRIDRSTSGLLLLAHDARTVQRMQRLLAQAEVTRTYLALARGAVAGGTIDRALVRYTGRGRRSSVPAGTPGAVPARTIIDVLARGPASSLIRATLVTGRTHQVRLHLAGNGHPILGDRVYGDNVHGDNVHGDNVHEDNVHGDNVHEDNVHGNNVHGDNVHGDNVHEDNVHGNNAASAAPRLMLHAWRLDFVHPNSHARVALCAPPPADFADVVRQACGVAADAVLKDSTGHEQ